MWGMATNWRPNTQQIIGALAAIVMTLLVYIFGTQGRINATAVETLHGRITNEATRISALEVWTDDHTEWSNKKLHTILDSIRTVGELGERGRIEAWQRFAVMFQYNEVLADYLGVPKHRRPVMPATPDTLTVAP